MCHPKKAKMTTLKSGYTTGSAGCDVLIFEVEGCINEMLFADQSLPSASISPLKRLTLRLTASSNTPARGSIRVNQSLARVIPV